MYNYHDAMVEDITNVLNDYEYEYKGLTRDTLEQRLNEDLWTDDNVTGNGSGSYTCDSVIAQEHLFDDPNSQIYISELIADFAISPDVIAEHLFDFEYWDVSIRCYLLPLVISDVLDSLADSDFYE